MNIVQVCLIKWLKAITGNRVRQHQNVRIQWSSKAPNLEMKQKTEDQKSLLTRENGCIRHVTCFVCHVLTEIVLEGCQRSDTQRPHPDYLCLTSLTTSCVAVSQIGTHSLSPLSHGEAHADSDDACVVRFAAKLPLL